MIYDIELKINDKKSTGTLQLLENEIILEVNELKKVINKKDIFAIKEISDTRISLLTTNKQIIEINCNKSKEIVNNLSNFIPYDRSTMINKKANYINSTLKTFTIITIIFLILYNGFTGITLADKWNVSPFSAFIGNILGDNGDKPMDEIQVFTYIVLFFEVIIIIIQRSKLKNDCLNILKRIEVKKDEPTITKYDELEKLKELLDKKVITQDDFDKKKEEILK